VSEATDFKAELRRLQQLQTWLVQSEMAPRLNAMVDLARSEDGVPVLPEELDRDPWLFNCANGTLELKAGRPRPHRREDLITKLAPVEYDPSAPCDLWLKFLGRIMGDNERLITYLQRVVGYALTGDVSEQSMWFLHGSGANGKSTFLAVLLAVFGDYGMQAHPELLMEKRGDSHPTERADLFGKRFVATIETEEGRRLAEALMKQLTGGDRVRARRMREDFWEFEPSHKIFLAANHKPGVRGTDHAVWRRIKLVPFTVTIPEAEKDPRLPEKLKAELPGVLAWAVRGCLDWQREGLAEPEEVRAATAAYRKEQDTVVAFLAACCSLHPSLKAKASALFEAYTDWSGDKDMTSRAFGDRLRALGYDTGQRTKAGYFWEGIGLQG
jgi:putative DNA primase/helicase